jgi:hypothetical protein
MNKAMGAMCAAGQFNLPVTVGHHVCLGCAVGTHIQWFNNVERVSYAMKEEDVQCV